MAACIDRRRCKSHVRVHTSGADEDRRERARAIRGRRNASATGRSAARLDAETCAAGWWSDTYRGNCFLIAHRSVIAECDSAIVTGRMGPEYNSGPTCSSEHSRILLRKYLCGLPGMPGACRAMRIDGARSAGHGSARAGYTFAPLKETSASASMACCRAASGV